MSQQVDTDLDINKINSFELLNENVQISSNISNNNPNAQATMTFMHANPNQCKANPPQPCVKCLSKLIKCDICGGFFLLKFYYDNHKNLCKTLNTNYREQLELIKCPECGLLVKFSEFQSHLCGGLKNESIPCIYCKKSFTLDLIEEHEKNCEKVQSDLLLLKEKIACGICKEMIPLIHIETHEKSCLELKQKQEKLEESIKSSTNIEYPDFWEKNIASGWKISDKIHLFKVSNLSEEFFALQDLILMTSGNLSFNFEIREVWRIQNTNLWSKYDRERLKIKEEKSFIDEKNLFFVNSGVKDDYIYTNGFDISFAQDNSPYGRGIYFERRADSVMSGTNQSVTLFIAKVIVGIPFVKPSGDTTLRKPPFYDQSKFIYYDSVTNVNNSNDVKDMKQTFVIYNNEKTYPLYMIHLTVDNGNNSWRK